MRPGSAMRPIDKPREPSAQAITHEEFMTPKTPHHSSGRPAAIDEADLKAAELLAKVYGRMTQQLGRAIVGQTEVLKQVMIALFCQGHCILEGVPGLAKTLMVSSIAQLLSLAFRRIQCTPALTPSAITWP